MNNDTQNVNWSDDDSSNEDDNVGEQPNRDFPPSDDEEELDDEYDMDEIRQLTIRQSALNQSNTWAGMFKNEHKEPTKLNILNKNVSRHKIPCSINNIKNLQTYEKRKFNPRLPPPDKYKKHNSSTNYKLNQNEFPTLK